MQDPELPQWVKSRIEQWQQKPTCGPTHGICRCFMEKLIDYELELSEARMNRQERARAALEDGQQPTMRVFGNSMRPMILTRSKLTYAKTDDYQVGDVVMCKVKGRFIDAHKITKVDSEGRFMIANNHGRENGWTRTIYGRVIAVNGESFGRPVGS